MRFAVKLPIAIALSSMLGIACSHRTAPASGPVATSPAPLAKPPAQEPESVKATGPAPSKPLASPEPTAAEAVLKLGAASIEFGVHPPFEPSPYKPSTLSPAPAHRGQLSKHWRLKKRIWVGYGYLHHAELSGDGQRVLTLSEQEGALRAYDVGTGKLRHRVSLPGFGEFDSVGFSALDDEQDNVLVVRQPFSTSQGKAPSDNVPLLIDLALGTFSPAPELPVGGGLRTAERPGLFGIVERLTDPQSGTLSFWWIQLRTRAEGPKSLDAQLALRLECAERPDDWALSKDGKLLAIAYYPSNRVELLDLDQRQVLLRLPAPKWNGSLALSPDSRLLALGGAELRVHLVPSGEQLAADDKYKNNIDTIRFTPQADLLLTSAYDGLARSYSLPQRLDTLSALPRPQTLAHGGANVYALAMTPDGRRLVTSSGDRTLKVWER